MIVYYDWNASPNCLKTKILLNELGIEYEQRDVGPEVLRSEGYRSMFPTGMAPALEDGEIRISESAAIALHLSEKHRALTPSDAGRRAKMFQALSIEAALVAPTMGGFGLFGELGKPESERHAPRIAELRARAQHVARVLGAVLGEHLYFAEELSIADIQLYAAVSKSLESGAFVDPPANLTAWAARMTDRPAVARAREQYPAYRKSLR